MAAIIRWASNSLSSALDMNSATLSGAIDVIVVEQPDGGLLSSPFHVRFGKLQLLKARGEIVHIRVNGQETPLKMRLGAAGEAFFVERVRDDLKADDGRQNDRTAAADADADDADDADGADDAEPPAEEAPPPPPTELRKDDEKEEPPPPEEDSPEEADDVGPTSAAPLPAAAPPEQQKRDLSTLLPKWYTERHLPEDQRETLALALESRAQKLSSREEPAPALDDDASVSSAVEESGAESGPDEEAKAERSWIWSYGSLPKKLPFSLPGKNDDFKPHQQDAADELREDDDAEKSPEDIVRSVLEGLVLRVETAAAPAPSPASVGGGARNFVRMLWSRTVGGGGGGGGAQGDESQEPQANGDEQDAAPRVTTPEEDVVVVLREPAEEASEPSEERPSEERPSEEVSAADDATRASPTLPSPTLPSPTLPSPTLPSPEPDAKEEQPSEPPPKVGLLVDDERIEAITASRFRLESGALLSDPRLRFFLPDDGRYVDLQAALPELVRSFAFSGDEERRAEEEATRRRRDDEEQFELSRRTYDQDIPRLLTRSTESIAGLKEISELAVTELTSSDNLAAIVGFDQIHPDLSHHNLSALGKSRVGLSLEQRASSSTLASETAHVEPLVVPPSQVDASSPEEKATATDEEATATATAMSTRAAVGSSGGTIETPGGDVVGTADPKEEEEEKPHEPSTTSPPPPPPPPPPSLPSPPRPLSSGPPPQAPQGVAAAGSILVSPTTTPPPPPTTEKEETSGGAPPNENDFVDGPSAAPTPTTPSTTKYFPYRKTLRPSARQIASLGLRRGANAAEFCVRKPQGEEVVVSATVYRWPRGARCVFADVDGVVAGSLGAAVQMPKLKLLARLGRPSPPSEQRKTRTVAGLFAGIAKHGYRIVYLTTRAIGVASATREALQSLAREDNKGLGLPAAPVLLAPGSLLDSGYYSGNFDATTFKAAALRNVVALFPGRNPLWAALARAEDDVSPYFQAGVPRGRVFRIFRDDDDPAAPAVLGSFDASGAVLSSYQRLADLLDQTFPKVDDSRTGHGDDVAWGGDHAFARRFTKSGDLDHLDQQFNDLNFWKRPLLNRTVVPAAADNEKTTNLAKDAHKAVSNSRRRDRHSPVRDDKVFRRPRANSDSGGPKPWPSLPLLRGRPPPPSGGGDSATNSEAAPPPTLEGQPPENKRDPPNTDTPQGGPSSDPTNERTTQSTHDS